MIKDNYNEIIARISEYAEPSTVTVVAVTKYQSLESANQAILCGIKDIGENRVQQLCERNELFLPVKKHLIGHLQTNKVKPAVAIADLIQSVDSVRVAVEIAKQASKLDKIQDVLIEINIADEATKTGASINDLNDIFNACANISGISVKGLMAVMPIGAQEYYFEKMYSLFQDAKTRNFTNTQLQTLSMGMSDDYPLAVEHGSNMIRVGRTLFK